MTDRQSQALKLAFVSLGLVPAKKDVADVIRSQLGSIENGVSVLGRNFPIAGAGTVDILATDRMGRLVLANILPVLDATALCRLFMQTDWMLENCEVLERFYPNLDAVRDVRHWVFVEEVISDVLPILNRFSKEVEAFKYRCLALGGEEWLVVERLGAKKESGRVIQIGDGRGRETLPEKKNAGSESSSLHFHSILSKDEVDEFFGSGKKSASADEDVTT